MSDAQFSDHYAALLEGGSPDRAREAGPVRVSEHAVQCLWFDQAFETGALRTLEGHRIEVISPGFWNQQAGPCFLSAQITFNGELHAGDVEVHLTADGWKAHGHHTDPRYDNVILHVVLEGAPPLAGAVTSSGHHVPVLLLSHYLDESGEATLVSLDAEEAAPCKMESGACSHLLAVQGDGPLLDALRLAAEWRMLHKARAIQLRLDRVGENQALYEMICYACGYAAFKHQFQTLARQLPYERAMQLHHEEPHLLEAALLHLGGLLPESLPAEAGVVPHFERLKVLHDTRLGGMRSLPLVWKRLGVRPANLPERRIAGVARLLARTAAPGLFEAVHRIWRESAKPLDRRREFEALFPRAVGFWAEHYTWTSERMASPVAALGPGRVRSIIGNVFVPVALAEARRQRDRALEERVLEFFAALPQENANHIVKRMVPRLWGDSGKKPPRITFQLQQGMLQFYEDWCEANPSCRNCTMHAFLERRGGTG